MCKGLIMHSNNSISDANKENSNPQKNNTPTTTNRVDINIRNTGRSTYYRAFASTDRHERTTLWVYEVEPLQDANVHGASWRR